MSEQKLKVVSAPEAKSQPETPPAEAPTKTRGGGRKRLRTMLLVVIPLVALLGGAAVYLMGGRYISTDNAYVGAQKVLITPDVSGKIINIAVREGQHVNPGDELFALDAEPYRLALQQARAKLATAQSDYEKLKTTYESLELLGTLAEKNVALKQADVARKMKLLGSQATSQADVDTSATGLVTAQLQAQYSKQQKATTLSQLLGDPNLPVEKFPEYAQAQAAVDEAERNLRLTTIRAPLSGIATQVENIQLGRYVTAGGPVLSVIDDTTPWVDANPKETDITYLRIGQKVDITVDSFPDHTFKGTVQSVSPGTGAQFSILPPQNASGNWVKVVQRVPVRIVFDKDEDTKLLRSGMSVTVDIDTGHSRLPSLFPATAKEAK
jgi:membrane fusion protein (multidrug efflux system)